MPVMSYLCSKCNSLYFGGKQCPKCSELRKEESDHLPMKYYTEEEFDQLKEQFIVAQKDTKRLDFLESNGGDAEGYREKKEDPWLWTIHGLRYSGSILLPLRKAIDKAMED